MSDVEDVRVGSRVLVRELGFLEQSLAGTTYPPALVHALVEISRAPGVTAAELAETLLLDRSTVSRMLRRLVGFGEIREERIADDRRQKALILTDAGTRTVASIDEFAASQVTAGLAVLDTGDRETVRLGLRLYADALQRTRRETPPGVPEVGIDEDLTPGDVAAIVGLHAREYQALAGFGVSFEALVAEELGGFLARAHPSSRLWVARRHGQVVGSIAVDLSAADAHVRWFLLAGDARGGGVGRRMLARALDHVDAEGVTATTLWTFQGLDAARTLYERYGFVLVEERPGSRWGTPVIEQRFRRTTAIPPRCAGDTTPGDTSPSLVK